MSSSAKRAIQLAKQRIKFARPIRMLMTPVMNGRLRRRDQTYRLTDDSAYIKGLKDSHIGERCFIIGNGPSLTPSDLDALAGEVSFAANGIYRIFEHTRWRPTYYICIDQNFLALESEKLTDIEAQHVFLDLDARRHIRTPDERVTYINWHRSRFDVRKFTTEAIEFSSHPEEYICSGHTVTYAAMQLALHMGFSEVYLLGVDHTYVRAVDSNGKINATGVERTHFFELQSGGYYYFEGVEFAYKLADQEARRRGCAIRNATRGGNLELFERADFDAIVGS